MKSKKRLFRKGGMEISINTIVVLILAITVLSIGLAFIRNMFGGTVSQLEEVSQEVKNQMIDKIKEEGGRVVLQSYEVGLKKSDTKTLYYGIRNELEDDREFDVVMECDQSTGGDIAGEMYITFEYIERANIAKDEIRVFPARIKVNPNAPIGFYECYITVRVDGDIYATKDFFIDLKR